MSHPLVIALAGAGSKSGRPFDVFRATISYLKAAGGYAAADFVEASYRVAPDGAPLPYTREDTELPLADLVERLVQSLRWFLRSGRPLVLLGWSMGGTVLFDAVARLLDQVPTAARQIRAIVTVASPLLGCDVDGFDLVGELAAGQAGRDLIRRAADAREKERIQADADRIRAAGINLVTIAAQEDAIVTPRDALLPAPGSECAFILRPRRRPGATDWASVSGHFDLPNDPVCWRRVLDAVGPAEPARPL